MRVTTEKQRHTTTQLFLAIKEKTHTIFEHGVFGIKPGDYCHSFIPAEAAYSQQKVVTAQNIQCSIEKPPTLAYRGFWNKTWR